MAELNFGAEPLVLEHKGNILLNYCFNITLYAPELTSPQRREALLTIFDEYTALYGPRLNWTTNPATGAWKKLGGGIHNYMTPHEWLMNHTEGENYSFLYHGGKKRTDASDVSFMVMAEAWYGVERHDLSLVSCRFPLADVRGDAVDLPELLRRWCALLRPLHARGGYSAGWWYDCYEERPLIYGTLADELMRYPGLQFDGVTETLFDEKHQAGLYNGPRCADWLIALSDPFLERLGGLNAVTGAMQPCPVLPYEGGAVLQAGDAPGPGSDGKPESLPDYLHLARVIEPVRARNLHYIICVPDSGTVAGFRPAQELTDAWCARFSGGNAAQADQI